MAERRAVLPVRLLFPLFTLALALGVGTAAFYAHWRSVNGTLIDALFMTFTTVTTIGYGEVHPLDTLGRVIAMVVATVGIGSLFYSFTVVMDYLVSEELRGSRRRRKMQTQIDKLSGHYIVAGLGRVGREAAMELHNAKVPFVVLDPGEEPEKFAMERQLLFIRGDATEDENLRRCGIERAKGLIATSPNDATNLYIVLAARILNSNLFIASRAVDSSSVAKLQRVGADRVISPYAIGGKRLAHLMLSPRVVDFFETALQRGSKALNIGDIVIASGTRSSGKALGDLKIPQQTGATVLCILREGSAIETPKGDLALNSGDHVLALGTNEQLEKLEVLLTQ